jgi:endoglucanase
VIGKTTASKALGLVFGATLLTLGCSGPADGDTRKHASSGGSGTTGGSEGGGAGGTSGGSVGAGGSDTSGGSLGTGGSGGSVGGSGGGSGNGDALPRFVGRWDDTHQSSWSGSMIELRFNGTDVSVTMSGANTWYDVIVDGGASTKMQIGATAQLATGLAAGDHVVQLVRRGEAFNGISKFESFSVPETSILPQQAPTRRIEVIGDSFAVAYGIDGCTDVVNGDEDAWRSWGWILGRAVQADVHIIATSGIGVIYNLSDGDNHTLNTYPLTFGWAGPGNWDFSKYTPDAVIIDLGTNDMNNQHHPIADNMETFKTSYATLLTTVRTNYPDAYIYGASHFGYLATEIQEVVSEKADAKIKFLSFDTGSNGACHGHLDDAGNQSFADAAQAALQADLGW